MGVGVWRGGGGFPVGAMSDLKRQTVVHLRGC